MFQQEQEKKEDKNIEKKITPRAENYSQWYLDIIDAAELAEHSPVKGCMVIKPNGYAIWEKTQEVLNGWFKEKGVRNAYFPMFIPERFLEREKAHVEGFSPEVAVVTHAGGKKLDEPLIVRPTSETIMYEVFSTWIHSYRDLPLLINQWANVVRWEMRPRLFLRTVEFLWQEGHTVHATHDEADKFAREMLDVYVRFAREYMALPVLAGVKSESEKFAGALRTYSTEAMMQDGKALQFATSHNLGDNFAKSFNVKFLDENNKDVFAWQTSCGLSTRTIGALVMAHSDDVGLIIPPKMCYLNFVLIPIFKNEEEKEHVLRKANEIVDGAKKFGLSVHLDERDNMRPGEKFFYWEKCGIPMRIELGPKDIAKGQVILVRRDTSEKTPVGLVDLNETIKEMLIAIQQNLYDRAENLLKSRTKTVDLWVDFEKAIEGGNFVLAHFCGDANVEKEIKDKTGATIRCISFDTVEEKGKCIYTGKSSNKRVIFAKAY